MKHSFFNNQKGYTLLFAVIVSTLTLAVAISILNLAKKEFLIATSTRDSAAALYAADGGLECALYGETGSKADGSPLAVFSHKQDNTANFSCSVPYKFTTVPANFPESGAEKARFVFHARFGSETEGRTSCAVVTVIKTQDSNGIKTTIQSRGYNTGWVVTNASRNQGTCTAESAKRVERALSYTTY